MLRPYLSERASDFFTLFFKALQSLKMLVVVCCVRPSSGAGLGLFTPCWRHFTGRRMQLGALHWEKDTVILLSKVKVKTLPNNLPWNCFLLSISKEIRTPPPSTVLPSMATRASGFAAESRFSHSQVKQRGGRETLVTSNSAQGQSLQELF